MGLVVWDEAKRIENASEKQILDEVEQVFVKGFLKPNEQYNG